MDNICQSVIQELAREMAQHQLPVQLIIPAILTFSKELLAESKKEDAVADESGGYKLGSGILDNGERMKAMLLMQMMEQICPLENVHLLQARNVLVNS